MDVKRMKDAALHLMEYALIAASVFLGIVFVVLIILGI